MKPTKHSLSLFIGWYIQSEFCWKKNCNKRKGVSSSAQDKTVGPRINEKRISPLIITTMIIYDLQNKIFCSIISYLTKSLLDEG